MFEIGEGGSEGEEAERERERENNTVSSRVAMVT